MQRLKFSFFRGEKLKFISHLEIMRLLQRALRRADIPVACSEGFNPQPRLSIAAPLPVGVTAANEPVEVFLWEKISPAELVQKVNSCLPNGFFINRAEEALEDEPPLMQVVDAALYRGYPLMEKIKLPAGDLHRGVEKISNREELIVERKGKKGPRQINLRPYIYNLKLAEDERGNVELKMFLKTGSQGGARPGEVVRTLSEWSDSSQLPHWLQLHREGLYRRGREAWEQL